MPYLVTGSPTLAFVDAIKDRLDGDAPLMALLFVAGRTGNGVYGHLPEAARTAYPYLILGQRHLDEGQARAMGVGGGRVSIQLDGWSGAKGASQMHFILSRVRVLLDRYPLAVVGFQAVVGSLVCDFEDVFDEPDEDKPGGKLYHGVQRWSAEVDEAA